MKKSSAIPYLACILAGAALAAILTITDPGRVPAAGFASAFLLCSAFLTILVLVWKKMNASHQAGWITAVAFFLRLLVGILLFILLPVYGYDEAPPNSGYLYLDAYNRDIDAWQLAQSEAPLGEAFSQEFTTDQYGGLLSLSAGIYRYLSPDSHRPLLILLVTSFAAAIGVPFLWKTVSTRWGPGAGNLCAWIYALYPESIILGGSQMREPILIGLSAAAFYGVSAWQENRKHALSILVSSLLGILFISLKAGMALCIVLALWFWMDHILPKASKPIRTAGWLLLGIACTAGLFASWNWLVDSSKWDLYLMESSSGRLQWEVELIGESFRSIFITAYGLAQPVLPAAIIYPGIPIMRTIAIFRALGWYMVVPLMLSGFIVVWKVKPTAMKWTILLFFAIVIIWTLVSSARAGGDQWDNPRYRAIFTVWMAVLAAWSWVEVKAQRSPWLWRLLFLEIVYSGFFIHWYLSRYYGMFKRLDFWPMVRLLVIIGALIVFGGWAYDRIRSRRPVSRP
jgi:hypothetical protein